MTDVDTVAILLAGYSIFCAASIALSHVAGESYRGQPLGRAAGWLLLAALAALQAMHALRLLGHGAWPDGLAYRALLFVVAPSAHVFCRSLLQPGQALSLRWLDLLHGWPLLILPWLPAATAQSLAFLLGAGYLLDLGRRLWALRAERARFQAEWLLLGLAFGLALAVAVTGMLPGLWPPQVFTAAYASAIGLAFLLVQSSLHLRPQLEGVVREAVQTAYAQTTLAKVDCDAALSQLQRLMAVERVFTDPDLSLASLAARLDLSPHQLSELLNTRLGKGFARFVREQRVEAAQVLLRDEAAASVLSVGLSVGFSATSNFYDAFREIAGTTPGQYRKLQRTPPATR